MNIVGIGFYDDFARFFNALKKEACKRKATFYYVTIFSSGFLYGLAKLSVFTWLTPSVWCKYIVNKKNTFNQQELIFIKISIFQKSPNIMLQVILYMKITIEWCLAPILILLILI